MSQEITAEDVEMVLSGSESSDHTDNQEDPHPHSEDLEDLGRPLYSPALDLVPYGYDYPWSLVPYSVHQFNMSRQENNDNNNDIPEWPSDVAELGSQPLVSSSDSSDSTSSSSESSSQSSLSSVSVSAVVIRAPPSSPAALPRSPGSVASRPSMPAGPQRRSRPRNRQRTYHHQMRRRSSLNPSSQRDMSAPPANQMGDGRYRPVDTIVSHQYRRHHMTFRVLRASSSLSGWTSTYYTLRDHEVILRPNLVRPYLVALSERRSLRTLHTLLRRVPFLRGLMRRRLLNYYRSL